jgi:anthranilate synthase/aminodeoxychorismate synthase-like glutamine amidotransferase
VSARLLLVDNYDSFTYNLVQAFEVLGAEVLVHRNDALGLREALALDPTHLCVSPGPGTPAESGISRELIRACSGRIPVLGVCLGHQAIVEVFGGEVRRATRPMHGKTSVLRHCGKGLFAGLPESCVVGRYHSLIAAPDSLPASLEVTAVAEDGEIMGVRHRFHPTEGVQFHPESILTPDGPRLLANFLNGVSHVAAA